MDDLQSSEQHAWLYAHFPHYGIAEKGSEKIFFII